MRREGAARALYCIIPLPTPQFRLRLRGRREGEGRGKEIARDNESREEERSAKKSPLPRLFSRVPKALFLERGWEMERRKEEGGGRGLPFHPLSRPLLIIFFFPRHTQPPTLQPYF